MGDGHIHICTGCQSESSGDCVEDKRDCAYPIKMVCAVCEAQNKRLRRTVQVWNHAKV